MMNEEIIFTAKERGDYLKSVRLSTVGSLKNAEKATGIAAQSIHKWESGERDILKTSVETLYKLAEGYGLFDIKQLILRKYKSEAYTVTYNNNGYQLTRYYADKGTAEKHAEKNEDNVGVEQITLVSNMPLCFDGVLGDGECSWDDLTQGGYITIKVDEA